jgi:hypothetical protein
MVGDCVQAQGTGAEPRQTVEQHRQLYEVGIQAAMCPPMYSSCQAAILSDIQLGTVPEQRTSQTTHLSAGF